MVAAPLLIAMSIAIFISILSTTSIDSIVALAYDAALIPHVM